MSSSKKSRSARKRSRSVPTVEFTPAAVVLPFPQSRASSSPPSICESQLAKSWRRYEQDHRGQQHMIDGFLCRWGIFGGAVRDELVAWIKAGAQHVCGR